MDLIVEGRLRNDDSSGGKSTQMLKKCNYNYVNVKILLYK